MQAVILAAGKSTRTRPLTLAKPKPLLRVADKTILEYSLEAIKDIADEIIQLINRFSSDAQLTKAYQTFDTEGELKSIGCSNATKMDDHNTKQPCRSHRDHAGNVIKRPKSRSAYKLELGK